MNESAEERCLAIAYSLEVLGLSVLSCVSVGAPADTIRRHVTEVLTTLEDAKSSREANDNEQLDWIC